MSAQLCTFHLGGLTLGVAVDRVQEVRRGAVVTPVPLAPAGVAGLLNLRGQIVSVIDARQQLGLAPRPPELEPVHVVLRSADETVSLLVDSVGDVIEVSETAGAVPSTVSRTIASMVTGVHTVAGALLLVLDADRALTANDRASDTGGT